MNRVIAMALGALLLGGTASAQTSGTSAEHESFYIQGFAQSSFGSVTSQAFGAEGGWLAGQGLVVFAELGLVRDSAPKTLGADAQIIAGYLTQVQSGAVTYSVRQPVRFVAAGLKYVISSNPRLHPYVLGGVGVAEVEHDVTFKINNNDVTDSLATYGVVLGQDLAGSDTSAMITVGGGVEWLIRPSFFVDAQYRFGHVFSSPNSTSINRVGLGVGFRF